MTFNAFTGICAEGPWHGKVKTFQSNRVQLANGGSSWTVGGVMPDPEGTYYYRQPSGPTPGSWVWVAADKEKQ
jgi:hypothetical protein